MKKFILMLSLFSISSFTFADTTAFERFLYEGLEDSKDVQLQTEKTRTEYRNVEVPSTCYRTVWRTRCHTRPPQCRQICDSRGICRTHCSPPRRVCNRYPDQIPYPCTRVERRAYQVHDYFVESNINLKFDAETADINPRESITVKVTGNQSMIEVDDSGNFFVFIKDTKEEEFREGDLLVRNLEYVLGLESAVEARNVVNYGIQNVKLRGSIFSFDLHNDFNFKDFKNQIRIYRNRRFGRDTLLKTAHLNTNNTTQIESNSNYTHYEVDINQLGVNIPSRMRVILDIEYNIDTKTLLNKKKIDTDTSTNWIFY